MTTTEPDEPTTIPISLTSLTGLRADINADLGDYVPWGDSDTYDRDHKAVMYLVACAIQAVATDVAEAIMVDPDLDLSDLVTAIHQAGTAFTADADDLFQPQTHHVQDTTTVLRALAHWRKTRRTND